MKRAYHILFLLVLLLSAWGALPARAEAQNNPPPESQCVYGGTRAAPQRGYTCVCSTLPGDEAGSCSWVYNYQGSTAGSGGSEPASCASVTDKFTPSCWFDTIKRSVGTLIIGLGMIILGFAGVVLNYTLKFTILEMSTWVSQMTSINVVWTTFRDLANLLVIFVLIYIAVQLILGLGKEWKKMLIGVVVGALLINFSLFFTKVAIDVSNTVAFQFYSSIEASPQNQAALALPDVGISWAFMKPFLVNTFFKTDAVSVDGGQDIVFASILLSFVFMLLVAFVFLAMAIMLVIRFATLIFLMATSPIYFAAMILPKAKKAADKWLDQLTEQLVFAPALMIGLWFVYKIVNDPQFLQMVEGRGNFASALQGASVDSLIVFFNFLVVFVLLLLVLVAAKNLGGSAGDFGTKWAGKLSFGVAGWAGRQSLGRLSAKTADSIKKSTFGATDLGRSTVGFFKKGASFNYDARSAGLGGLAKAQGVDLGKSESKGFVKDLDEKVKEREAYAKDLGTTPIFHDEEAKKVFKRLETSEKETEKGLQEIDRKITEALVEGRALTEAEREDYRRQSKEIQENLKKIRRDKAAVERTGAYKPQEVYAGDLESSSPWSNLLGLDVRKANKAAAEKIKKSLKDNKDQKLMKAIKEATKDTDEEAPAAPAAAGPAAAPTAP